MARLRLIRSQNVGPVTYRQLIARYGSAEAALAVLPDMARRAGGRAIKIASDDTVKRECDAVDQLGARHVFIDDDDYPPLLSQLADAPPVLIIRGNMALVQRRAVAIVGARNASAAACRFARTLAAALGDAGIVVVSGLARGIDTAAHAGALDSGTAGVIASGIDIAFPPDNAALQESVAQRGVLIAEQPPGTQPLARHFPFRNRIIAGMTEGTVVVEAAPRSGSLITARLANEAGRDVMAVPGSPLDPRAQGCNALIRDGATLIQSAADVVETLGGPCISRLVQPALPHPAVSFAEAGPPERAAVQALLSHGAVEVDEIVRQSGLPAATVQTALLDLELAGRLERHAGGRVKLA